MTTKRELRAIIKDQQKKIYDLKMQLDAKEIYQLVITRDNDTIRAKLSFLSKEYKDLRGVLKTLRDMYKGSEAERKTVVAERNELRKEVEALRKEVKYFADLCDKEVLYNKAKEVAENE